MRLYLCCLVAIAFACQSDSEKGERRQADSKAASDASVRTDAAIEAGALDAGSGRRDAGSMTARDALTRTDAAIEADASDGSDQGQQTDPEGPKDASVAPDAGTEAGASDAEGEREPSNIDWILNQSCEPSTDPDTCKRCQAEKCCETRALAQSPEPYAYAQCTSACVRERKQLTDCYTDCDKQHPEGTGAFAAAVGCNRTLCNAQAECRGSTTVDCENCLETQCTEEFLTIFSTREGFLWFLCNGACRPGDGVCVQQCMALYPELEEALDRMTECQASRCPSC